MFSPETKQNDSFEKSVRGRVDAMFEESALVMSYGITNAGRVSQFWVAKIQVRKSFFSLIKLIPQTNLEHRYHTVSSESYL